MKIKALFTFIIFFLIVNVNKIEAQTQEISPVQIADLTCKVNAFLVNNNPNLPYDYKQLEIVNGSSHVSPGDNIVYTLDFLNKNSERFEISKIYVEQISGNKEPIAIKDVRLPNGSHYINPNDKSIIATYSYSTMGGSESSGAEFLFQVIDNPNNYPKTSTLFSVQTNVGIVSCASLLWINSPIQEHPINWETNYALFSASDFYLDINGEKFYGKEPVAVQSDPGSNKYTTLEMIWNENDKPMRLFMYYRVADSGVNKGMWEIFEIRTYDGSQRGEWLYYEVVDQHNSNIASLPGHRHYIDWERIFKEKNGNSEIHITRGEFNAFMAKDVVFPNEEYYLEPLISTPNGQAITISNDPMTGYGVNVLLKDKNGVFVKDQSQFVYEWTTNNPNVLHLSPNSVVYSNGNCAYGAISPCPQLHIDISGIQPGYANVSVAVLNKDDRKKITSTTFSVNVVDSQTEESCASHGETISKNSSQQCCDATVLVQSPNRPDIYGICTATCSSDLDCFDSESCQYNNFNQLVCSKSNDVSNDLQEIKQDLDEINKELESQKKEQSKLREMLDSIMDFFSKIFKLK